MQPAEVAKLSSLLDNLVVALGGERKLEQHTTSPRALAAMQSAKGEMRRALAMLSRILEPEPTSTTPSSLPEIIRSTKKALEFLDEARHYAGV